MASKDFPDVMGELLSGSSGSDKSQQAGIPANQDTSKPASQDTGEPVSQPETPKVKATYYLSSETVDALEAAKLALRRLAPAGNKRQISTSAIVDVAIQLAMNELEAQGSQSQLASKLVNQ